MGEGIPEFLKRHCEHPSPAISCVGCKRNPTFEDHNTKPVLISCASIKIVQSWGIWKELLLYTSISLYRAFPSTQLSKVGLPLPVSLFLRNRGGLVNGVRPSSVKNGSNISTEPVWISWVYNKAIKIPTEHILTISTMCDGVRLGVKSLKITLDMRFGLLAPCR